MDGKDGHGLTRDKDEPAILRLAFPDEIYLIFSSYLYSSRNAPGEERCVTTLKTAV